MRAISVNNLFASTNNSNCEDDTDQVLTTIGSRLSSTKSDIDTDGNTSYPENENDIFLSLNINEVCQFTSDDISITNKFAIENALFYISGYITHKTLMRINNCLECRRNLIDDDFCLNEKSLFLTFKEYDDNKQLKTPSPILFECIKKVATIIQEIDLNNRNILKNIVKRLTDEISFKKLCIHDEHQMIIEYTVNVSYSLKLIFLLQ